MIDFLFMNTGDREKAMTIIDSLRATTIYEHNHCSEECKLRGMYAYASSNTLALNSGNWHKEIATEFFTLSTR